MKLDSKGRCCGAKPIFYKTRNGLRNAPDPHWFCPRCDRAYNINREQRENWAWINVDGEFMSRKWAKKCGMIP